MTDAGAWGGITVVALLSSLWVASRLPDAASGAAPDGRRRPAVHAEVGTLEGAACERDLAAKATIASASLITDEILLELVPPERLVAVSYVVDRPGASPVGDRFPRSTPRTWGHAEQLIRLDADRILLSEYTGSVPRPQLVAAGRCVGEVGAPRSVSDLLRTIHWLGLATGTEARAEVLTGQLEARIARWPSPPEAARSRALVVQGSMVYGIHTLLGDCLSRAGLFNVAGELGIGGSPLLGTEVWLQLPLDILFVAAPVTTPGAVRREHLPGGVLWEETPVFRRGRFVAVPESWVGSLSHHALRACDVFAQVAAP